MKAVLASLAGVLIASTSVLAADLPSRRAPPVYVAPVSPAFNWTGFYLGLNAGYAFNGDQAATLIANDPLAAPGLAGGFVPPFFRSRANGFTGGGQFGYNYEFANTAYFGGNGGVVVGLEADIAYTDLSRSNTVFDAGGFTTPFAARTEYVGTARGRIGYAFDNFLVYGTGGFAYGGVKSGASVITPAGAVGYTGATDSIRTGYAYGGGVEYALPVTSFLNFFHSSAVTIKGEFIHYDLGTSSTTLISLIGPASSFTDRVKTQGNLVRAGINYKFGMPVAPVVARY